MKRELARRTILSLTLVVLGACKFHPPDTTDDANVDPLPTVGFESATTLADENSATLKIPVVISADTGLAQVGYRVSGGTATRDADYTLVDGVLTFDATLRADIDLTIISDGMMEQDETIALELTSPVGVTIVQPSHVVTISSDILPRAKIKDATASAMENAAASTIEIDLDIAPKGPVSVDLSVGGTSTAADRSLVNTTVMFATGETSKLVPVGIINDALDETNETVDVTLQNPVGLVIDMAANAETFTIIDDDATPSLTFTSAGLSQSEGIAGVTATVTLSAPSGLVVTVDYAQSGGNAVAADFTLGGTGTLTFQPGETSHDIPITILQDTLDEANETAVIQLSNPSNATLPGGDFTLVIVDDDTPPSVSFALASSSVTEGASAGATLTVNLSAASGLQVTVPFSAGAGSTAANPGDFTFGTGSPLTFAPGVTSRTIQVNISNDNIGEVDELLNVTLGAPTNASLGATPTHALTIVDDDCLGSGPFRVCPVTAPAGAVNLSGTLVTTNDARCAGTQPAGWTAGGQVAACFIIAQDINVNGALTVTGTRPLVLFAAGSIIVSSSLDAAGHLATAGPGAPFPSCAAFARTPESANGGGGGGAGASFMNKGGDGGSGDNGNQNSGLAAGPDGADPTLLRGGCNGQDGGDGNGASTNGFGGKAGGAVYLVAGTITISGSINVSGGGGGAGAATTGGAAGGGAGGMLVLDAATLNANGVLMSNGGGGGQGADNNTNGGPGADPSPGTPLNVALGGNVGSTAGAVGGNGFADVTAATAGTNAVATEGGGGGGGAGGFIKGSGPLGGTVTAGKIVP